MARLPKATTLEKFTTVWIRVTATGVEHSYTGERVLVPANSKSGRKRCWLQRSHPNCLFSEIQPVLRRPAAVPLMRKSQPSLQIHSAFTPLEAQAAMSSFLSENIPFDVLVAASDVIAINAIGVMRAHGLRVPEDVKVVGYDDIDQAAHSFPPLTSDRQSIDQVGEVITNCLLSMLKGENVSSELIATALVVRESSKAV